jgi:hypothetical protein
MQYRIYPRHLIPNLVLNLVPEIVTITVPYQVPDLVPATEVIVWSDLVASTLYIFDYEAATERWRIPTEDLKAACDIEVITCIFQNDELTLDLKSDDLPQDVHLIFTINQDRVDSSILTPRAIYTNAAISYAGGTIKNFFFN